MVLRIQYKCFLDGKIPDPSQMASSREVCYKYNENGIHGFISSLIPFLPVIHPWSHLLPSLSIKFSHLFHHE